MFKYLFHSGILDERLAKRRYMGVLSIADQVVE
jgi:hypothetical protein